MRVALVSPYSWTYPGGVTRHIESLARELHRAGHDVKAFAPCDADRRRAAILHRGARPQERDAPPWLVPLGGTTGWSSNGSVSNLARMPPGVSTLRRELRAGGSDVVHVHEPAAPSRLGRADERRRALVGTFHCYSDPVLPYNFATLLGARRAQPPHPAVAVSEAAAWTGRRFYGGPYRVIPNGVDAARRRPAAAARRAPGDPLRIVFVGQAVERKGLPVLLRASRRCAARSQPADRLGVDRRRSWRRCSPRPTA